MKQEGHIGVSLLTVSPIVLAFVMTDNIRLSILFVLTVSIISNFPDIDIWISRSFINKILGIKHRGVTHTILFSTIIGILTGLIYYSIGIHSVDYVNFTVGFMAGFLSIVSHIFADLFNPTGVKFMPSMMDSNYSWSMFNYNNVIANFGFLIIGIYSIAISYSLLSTLPISIIISNYIILIVFSLITLYLSKKVSWKYNGRGIKQLNYLRPRKLIKTIFRF
jgi:inner membrane protein